MLWNRPIGPKSAEATILRRLMQAAIGDALRDLYEAPLELPYDLRELVKKIDERSD
jgi:hypothetical protein